jgi:hypothetical protein
VRIALALLFFSLSDASQATLSLQNVRWDTKVLSARATLNLDAELIAALEAHVAFWFIKSWRCGAYSGQMREELFLAPLSRQYRVRASDGSERSFRLRSEALSAIEEIALVLDQCVQPPELRMALDLGALPAPLRVPALLDARWQLDSNWLVAESP